MFAYLHPSAGFLLIKTPISVFEVNNESVWLYGGRERGGGVVGVDTCGVISPPLISAATRQPCSMYAILHAVGGGGGGGGRLLLLCLLQSLLLRYLHENNPEEQLCTQMKLIKRSSEQLICHYGM